MNKRLYKTMVLIRKFEERLLKLFDQGLLVGTTHTYIGQEAVGVGIISALGENDIIFSNHRCHGHFLTYCGEAALLMAEIMGKEGGVVGGRGGSQHIQYKNFYSNGIQGGIVPNATGAALAEKIKGNEIVSVVFIGDGTLGEGVVYESMNIASLWDVPLLIVIENNRYAQTTPISHGVSGKIIDRPRAFGIKSIETDSFEVEEIYEIAKKLIEWIRTKKRPAVLVCNTYRFAPHSKGDDFRDKTEIDNWKKKDPIILFEQKHNLSEPEIQKVEEEIKAIMDEAENYGRTSPHPVSLFE